MTLHREDRERRAGEGRPGDTGDLAHRGPDAPSLLKRQGNPVHGSQGSGLLGAADVVELLVDLDQVVGDLSHGLLPGELRHEARHAGHGGGVGQECPNAVLGLEPTLDLPRYADHQVVLAGRYAFHEPVRLDLSRRLLGQLDPPRGGGSDLCQRLSGVGSCRQKQRLDPSQVELSG